jgi:Ca2+-binding RTX toxin-like protein
MRGGGSIALRVVTAASLVVGSLLAGASAASAAPLCQNDLANHTLTATPQNGGGMMIKAASGWLSVNDVSCIQLDAVNTVFIDMSPYPTTRVTFDLTGGPLAPGYTNEGNGSSEIEFQILGLAAGSSVKVVGTGGSDGIGVGQYLNKFTSTLTGQINLNSLVDAGSLDPDVTFQSFPDRVIVDVGDAGDTVSGTGGGGLTGTFSKPIEIADIGTGEDHFTGGSADDLIEGVHQGFTPDTYSGGAGTDTLQLEGGSGASASITLDGVANDGIDCPGVNCSGANVAADFEHVIGGAANETIVGTANADVLEGGAGTNMLQGADGNDALLANQQGVDDFSGGVGRDTVTFVQYWLGYGTTVTQDDVANDGLSAHQTSNVRSDIEIVVGTGTADSLTGNDGPNTLNGSSGTDQLFGLGGKDMLIPAQNDDATKGGPGRDTLSFATAFLPITIYVISGNASGDGADTFASVERFIGSPQADTFNGGLKNDEFLARAGNDTLNGGDGNDTLEGQAGNDNFDGGAGTDVCSQGVGTGSKVNCEA